MKIHQYYTMALKYHIHNDYVMSAYCYPVTELSLYALEAKWDIRGGALS